MNAPKVPDKPDVPESALPIEEVAKLPLPGMAIPEQLAFSPDDGLITYLLSPEGGLTNQLYSFDPETGAEILLVASPDEGTTEEDFSLEEALRRERQRQLSLGVTQYAWARHVNRILVPLRDGLYVKDGPDGPLRKIVGGNGTLALDAQFSPDGNWVAYVENAELYVVPFEGGKPRQLTRGARRTGKTHGLAEFVAQEEMGRPHGFWWSPDGQWIAFAEVDERHIPVYRIVHQGKDAVGESAQEDQRYPFAGEANAKVRLGVVPVAGGEAVWMDLGDEDDFYLARVAWLPDGGLTAQLQNRGQTELQLVRFDPASGRRTVLLRETSDVWINLHGMFRPLEGGAGGFVWASERTGFRHLYLHDERGNTVRALTQGEWMVDDIARVDEERELVYFTGTREGPTESHLYAVSFTGGEPRRITREPGLHAVVVDHGCRRFIDVHQALDRPPAVTLHSLADGAPLRTIYDRRDTRIDRLGLEPPELVTLETRGGATLYGAMYRPLKSFGEGPHRTIVYVYGGPRRQLVANSWGPTVNMRAQYLRSLGFLVFALDNRGSARRGLAFEGAVKYRMGQLEVQDQVDGVQWLVDQGLADPGRVGINGRSYGGYMAAMCLAQAPDTFRVAVAEAPVTHWDGYDTHYTERYMGTPQSNPRGYTEGSVMHYVEDVAGRLLLVHGLIDENVHFRHSARLINALVAAGKPYELLLYPDERHRLRGLENRIYLEERIGDFFLQHL